MTDIIVDNFSIQPEPGVGCELNILHNGDVNYEDTRSWAAFYAGRLETYSYTDSYGDSDTAIKYVGSKYWHEGVGQRMDRLCLDAEMTFFTSADVKLFEADGTTPYTCNATIKTNPTKSDFENDGAWRCPVIAIVTQQPGTFPKFVEVADHKGDWDGTGWNKMEGQFQFTEEQIAATKMWIEVHNTKPGLTFVVDNFVLKKVPTESPTSSPTLLIEEIINGTDGKSVGPNTGDDKLEEFTLAPDGTTGNYTYSPVNETEMTFAPEDFLYNTTKEYKEDTPSDEIETTLSPEEVMNLRTDEIDSTKGDEMVVGTDAPKEETETDSTIGKDGMTIEN